MACPKYMLQEQFECVEITEKMDRNFLGSGLTFHSNFTLNVNNLAQMQWSLDRIIPKIKFTLLN